MKCGLLLSHASRTGVFTELLGKIGVKDVQVAEVWDLSPESLQALQ